jgi:diguanylate cyclase (GGDEF)-like protein
LNQGPRGHVKRFVTTPPTSPIQAGVEQLPATPPEEVLKAIAACASANLHRPMDLAARYGGEEFAAILPNTDINGAVQVAEGIRRAVMARGLPHGAAESGFVSVSIGVASTIPHAGDSAASLLERADAALYEAKRLGRNRTEARFVRLAVPARPAA